MKQHNKNHNKRILNVSVAHDTNGAENFKKCVNTRLPRIWLIAALSFNVHSATTLARISFMYNMNAFKGFFIWGFFSSSFLTITGVFLEEPHFSLQSHNPRIYALSFHQQGTENMRHSEGLFLTNSVTLRSG